MRPPRHSLLAATAYALLAAPPALAAQAQVSPIVTDRPDQTESSVTVPPGFVQLELGWVHTGDETSGGTQRAHTVPGVLIRVGLAPRLEGRLGFDGWTRRESASAGGNASESGVGDLAIQFKYQFLDARALVPQAAVIAGVTLPTGQTGFSAERADPSVRLAFSHELSERVGLGYNAGVQWTSEAGPVGTTTVASGVYTAVLGFALASRLGAFAEVFGEFTFESPRVASHSVDGGFTFLLADNLQLDLSAGRGISDAAEDWFVSAGFSVRLPR